MTTSNTNRLVVAVATLLFLGSLGMAMPAQAQQLTLETTTNDYYRLKAKVVYLTAWVEALREGKQTPPPTFTTILDGSTVTLVGTITRNPLPDVAEVCGPISKGTLDWGDGTAGSIVGLGCAGDASTFEVQHTYTESGSYEIKVRDHEQRSTTRVVAVNVTN